MTHEQIRAIVGEPQLTDRSPCCEVWFYWFENHRILMPGNRHKFARTGTFVFDNNGLLKEFGYNP
jgi:outer membrane protein assembly factor BamE (lipoprotein component of BamABCDE complex)